MAHAPDPEALDPTAFASLLCSKLCHDLLSPVSALGNGLELLEGETDPVVRDQCMGLIGDGIHKTAGKLKFFRLAFGAAGGFGESIPTHEIRTAIEGMFPPEGRLALQWMIAADGLSRPAAKLLLNLAMIAGEALPRGGTMALGAELAGDRAEIVVRGEGPRITLDASIRAALLGQEKDVTTRTAMAHLVRTTADRAGGELMLSPAGEPFLLFGARIRLS